MRVILYTPYSNNKLVFNAEFHFGNVLQVFDQVGQFGVQLSGGEK
jgi:hypothetical protein